MTQLATHTITGRRDGPHLLILGGVHGDEYEPVLVARELARMIAPDQLAGRLTIAPCVNEPAMAANARCGPDGLDLARTCPGDANGSITQQIAHAVSQLIHSADYLIDMHTGGRALFMAELSGYMLHQDKSVREKQQQMAEAFGAPIIWATSDALNGRTLSVARDANVPAIYVEFGGGSGVNAEVMTTYRNGCRGVMAALEMLEDAPPPKRIKHRIIDPRNGSGVLQVQHPAPSAGIFVPSAILGTPIRTGESIGVVTEIATDREHEIAAADDGVLVALRVLPSVQTGDALGAVAVHHPGETS